MAYYCQSIYTVESLVYDFKVRGSIILSQDKSNVIVIFLISKCIEQDYMYMKVKTKKS